MLWLGAKAQQAATLWTAAFSNCSQLDARQCLCCKWLRCCWHCKRSRSRRQPPQPPCLPTLQQLQPLSRLWQRQRTLLRRPLCTPCQVVGQCPQQLVSSSSSSFLPVMQCRTCLACCARCTSSLNQQLRPPRRRVKQSRRLPCLQTSSAQPWMRSSSRCGSSCSARQRPMTAAEAQQRRRHTCRQADTRSPPADACAWDPLAFCGRATQCCSVAKLL